MMNTVAPVWDGNETWLVLGGAGLLAAFPLAYSVILTALLSAAHPDAARPDLSRRRLRVPVQGQRRARGRSGTRPSPAAPTWRPSSRVSRSARFIGGIRGQRPCLRRRRARLADAVRRVHRRRRSSSPMRCSGCTWLDHEDRGRPAGAMTAGPPARYGLLVVIAAVSIWTPLAHPDIAAALVHVHRTSSVSRPCRCWSPCSSTGLLRALRGAPHGGPFLLALGLVFLGYSGLGISLWPNIIPPIISIWEAAGRRKASASRSSARCSSSRSSSATRLGPITCSAARSAPARATTDG